MLKIETYKPKQFSDLVERIWVFENPDKEITLTVPPNQYVNFILPLNNSIYKRNHMCISTPQIEGISTQNTFFRYPKNTKLLGIRFYAFGLFPFSQLQGKDLLNNYLTCPFDSESLKNEMILASSETDIIRNVDDLLSNLFHQKSYESISVIMNFYNKFRWNDELDFIEDYCNDSATNYTSLNRNFSKIIGISPKKFERLIKFRKSLCSLIHGSTDLTSISVNAGYFDQAHFIREFKIFLDQTPSKYKSLLKQADKNSHTINYNFELL